ncbi:MgtC/SapB family protein [Tissierella carlieri]|jgi:putative Mg2+ transporter-C (MgtC) family protein|uniref:MgtC/SapB family protein n=1 Tax=Tissierella TaxID=41273 RepID=UPI000BA15121|nr:MULTISPECIES: MgtC/SapB family protein [Tissierella]MBU5312536.1 MgtC/SapB family protein [Tissierella carlieri]MDU5081739.1 MgtC/SapB family protein [Bacillota bacterium]OZV10592.1 methyltransferase [Tissierella sp. P1]
MISRTEIVTRLLLSAIIGGFIGTEREVNNRPAGLRTHILVTLGSTLVMLVSIDGFQSADPSRLAAQVVSGIGFLGAGTIMRTGNNISGLTTAASLWVCAGIGLAVGAGYYLGAIVTTAIVLATLMSLGIFEKRILRKKYQAIEVIATNRPGIIGQIGVLFGKHYVSIKDITILNNDNEYDEDSGIMEIRFLIKTPNNFNINNLYKEIYQIHGIISVSFEGNIIPHNKDIDF